MTITTEAARQGYEAMQELAKRGYYKHLLADDASFVRMYMEELRVASLGPPCPICNADPTPDAAVKGDE